MTGVKSRSQLIKKDFISNKHVYLMAIPMLTYYILFHYGAMYGAIIAFKDFRPSKGILRSSWAGLTYFRMFFTDVYFLRIILNTLAINALNLAFGFPMPIIFALLLNEIRNKFFKRTVQTISYLPYFISTMVICGMIIDFVARDGIITKFFTLFGLKTNTSLLLNAKYFRPIYITSEIWAHMGWGAVIYISALTGIDPQLYEAAEIDGAKKFRQLLHITLPGIIPTIIIMLILRLGSMMNVGFEKIILLYNTNIYSTADVISSYVYRRGLLEFNFSYGAAVGLFNSVVNFTLVFMSNWISRKVGETSLF